MNKKIVNKKNTTIIFFTNTYTTLKTNIYLYLNNLYLLFYYNYQYLVLELTLYIDDHGKLFIPPLFSGKGMNTP